MCIEIKAPLSSYLEESFGFSCCECASVGLYEA